MHLDIPMRVAAKIEAGDDGIGEGATGPVYTLVLITPENAQQLQLRVDYEQFQHFVPGSLYHFEYVSREG